MQFLSILVWSLLGTFTATVGTETDIDCLKYIKASLEDPFGYLKSSWDFTNKTEGYICRFSKVDCWNNLENRVLNLRLSGLGLRGRFPLGIQNCTSLTGLDLSNNELQGSIPFNISIILPFITSLDLSSNNFSGEIPSNIANCSCLNFLKLDHNRLTGHIPEQIGWLTRLKVFSVSNNLLSGPVPRFQNVTISADSYANNVGLCGGPLERCRVRHPRKFDYSFNSGFAIGYVVFSVSVVTVYASYCVPWVKVGKRSKMITVAAMVMLMIRRSKHKKTEVDQLGSMSTMEFLLETQISRSEKYITRMNFRDLSKATENFSQQNIIGVGQMGTMYKATLPNGWSIAVKRLSNLIDLEEHFDLEEQFMSELKTLGKLRHENLLTLFGFCVESKERLLVYKYISNGNLFDWLHSTEDKKKILEWPLRVKIAVGLARGMAWLHHGNNFRVAHLNISSKCILLDQNFEPKLSNFGKAMLINPNEINSSSSFSIDIEFWEQCYLKEDVFYFGIVLLELITGKKATSLTNSDDGSLDKWISDFSSSFFCLYDAIDNPIIGQGHDAEIFEFLGVAYKCVQGLPEQRPSMLDVYKTVSIIGERYYLADNSEISEQTESI
ncbi:probably inactive leucine-rich repeat receptor-like protein kinase At5g48380 [Hevea brasiliensis]|uniref:probably inactive leucine-rich repeat receptor-like protein kinase At5g48380 n=1 Tax=Hevea brasiliensis TaxID=3981 RepID=UPI0025F62123|nr:probably inactive leucine-rich repeat receptor-like protein kinase At5g48380 [Hevea brasiliensis]